ncbi:uncharacterized protein LOC133526156 [Cydia pomonella]|uniref:uncharacterized protein LOC133526156 n=1 Tax=Cydia pomonella TaxID=82600 RepID=UPI002ADDA22D|nr:uncharacterized protein LOC133526156 [Cydia pomonella]
MHFEIFYILLLVVVVSFDFVRSDENYDAAIDDNADEGVDDDEGVADDAGEDLGAANGDDAVADDDAVNDDAMTNDPVNADIIEAEDVNLDSGSVLGELGAQTCVGGTYIQVDCNICFCYKSNIQGCTTALCSVPESKERLSSNPAKRLTFKKLRDHATGCVPGETIKHENCECRCTIPSVLTCPKNCLR